MVSGGFASDYVYKLTGKLVFSRKLVVISGLIICGISVGLGGFATTTTSAVILMAVGLFFQYLACVNFWVMIQDTVRKENVGGVSGFVHCMANTSGIIGPALTGFLVEFTGSFFSAFILAGLAAFVSAIAISIFVKPLKNEVKHVSAGVGV